MKLVVDNGEEKELREYKVEELNFRPKKKKDVKLTEEELKELEGLEDETAVEETSERTERPRKFNKERNFNKDRNTDRDRSFDKDRNIEKDRSFDKDRNTEKDRSSDKDRNFDKERNTEKERNADKERSFDKERQPYHKERYNKFQNGNDAEKTVTEVQEDVSVSESGETHYYKKRYDGKYEGKGKRYFGKNKRRNNNAPEK